MSIKVNLNIVRRPDIELFNFGIFDIRLTCDIAFPPHPKYSAPIPAIIDTGAPMSVIPYPIWAECFTKIIEEDSYLSGIVPGAHHIMRTKIGIISAVLTDKRGVYYPIAFRAHFAPIKRIPIILGIQDIIDKAIVNIAIKEEDVWLEFKV